MRRRERELGGSDDNLEAFYGRSGREMGGDAAKQPKAFAGSKETGRREKKVL